MRVVAIIQARMGSTRLPGKVMMDLAGSPVLLWVIRAAHFAVTIHTSWIATSLDTRDDTLAEWSDNTLGNTYRGSETDVLSRMYECACAAQADIVVRLTGDCPFHDPHVIDDVVSQFRDPRIMYASNVSPPTWPDGMDVQACRMKCLEAAHKEATRLTDRDTVMQYIERNRDRWPAANVTCPLLLASERWVLDTEEDLEFCRRVAPRIRRTPIHWNEVLTYLDAYPEVRGINKRWARNERFHAAVGAEDIGSNDRERGDRVRQRALRYAAY
jgi:spore coat polysaccharide biosynthesis protein SpsF (cytidylyltransferase family)